jgi:DNA-binding Lrp family transcriptional regulator
MSTQLRRIAKQLRRNNRGPGITVAKLAKLANVSKDTVYKRVHDLRQEPGRVIYSNYRVVNGERKLYYRIAA